MLVVIRRRANNQSRKLLNHVLKAWRTKGSNLQHSVRKRMRDRWQICLVRRDNWRKERIREGLERKRRCAGGVAQTRERHTGGVSMMRHGQERTRFGHVRERCGKARARDAELLRKDRRRVAGLLREMRECGGVDPDYATVISGGAGVALSGMQLRCLTKCRCARC
jgi:hypothetical protein